MTYCKNCGAEHGVGRFCVNCGAPVADPAPELVETQSWSALDETAVRPAVPGPLAPIAPVVPPTPVPSTGPRRKGPRRRTPTSVWVVLALVLLLVAVLGSCLAMSVGDGGTSADEPTVSPTTTTPAPSATAVPTGDGEASVNLSGTARIEGAPQPMAPGAAYGTGERVSYVASNMLDKDPSTVYRLSGDASGTRITFDLGEARTITAVGLVNGYAKTSRDGSRTVDQYAANRRVLLVEWTFDDGTVVEQELTDTREPQSLQIDDELTSRTVTLRILEVSAPGTGPYARNSTALGSVLLLGF